MNEIALLKGLLQKQAFNKYYSSLDLKALRETNRTIFDLFRSLEELHNSFPDTAEFTLNELRQSFWASYPDAPKETFEALFAQAENADVGPDVVHHVLATIDRRKRLLAISEQAYKVSAGLAEMGSFTELVAGLDKPTVAVVEDDVFVTTNVEELVHEAVSKPGIRWRLDCLNKSIGSLRKGDFGFTFARPETGKTTFIADVASNALEQVEQPVIWFNNEEQDNKVMLRVIQSYFGITMMQLMGNLAHYNKEFNAKVGHKFLLVNSSRVDISRTTVERILEAKKPSLVIYDQIDKIKGFKADRDDLVYGAIYQWARELAKVYAPSIGVSQADGSGEGQKWLTMGNVANAKTSKQAEADFIIGIGKTADMDAEYIRYINISKNKLMGDSDSNPALRHGRFECIIEPQIARYKDVMRYE